MGKSMKIHYFDWAMFNSYVNVDQAGYEWPAITCCRGQRWFPIGGQKTVCRSCFTTVVLAGFCAGFKTWKIMEEKPWHDYGMIIDSNYKNMEDYGRVKKIMALSKKNKNKIPAVYPRLGKINKQKSGLAIHNPSSDSGRQAGTGHDYFLPLKNPPIRSFEIGTNPGTLW